MRLINDIGILLRLFKQGLKPQQHRYSASVKDYYTNEQYDWITDTQFPEKVFHDLRRAALTKKALIYITQPKVLDLGCGTGLITQVLPGEVTGLDISPWKIERARQHCPKATFLVGDIENTSSLLADNSFDAVVCTDILEHIEAPNNAVVGVLRVLKPEGIFIGTVPSKCLIWKLRRFLTTADASGEPFHTYYSKKMLQQLLQSFSVLEVSYQCYGLELFFAASKRDRNA